MDGTLLAQFWVIAVLLALTPGADWAYAIAAGLRARSVVPSVLGMVSGYGVVVVVVAVGVGTLITQWPVVLTALTVAGACYLLRLGVTTLVRPVAQVGVSDRPVDGGPGRQFLRGLGVSAINPKGLLLLLALLPQFTSPTGWPSPAQMLVLGSLHLLDCAVVYSTVALLARRVLSSRPRAATATAKLSGAVMTLIGGGILVENLLVLA